MKNIQREDIRIISQYSNLSEDDMAKALQEKIYPNRLSWQKFLRLFFLILGIGFTLSGIVFFFAYNWADLHKFIKLGVIEILLVAATSIALLPKLHRRLKKIILTGSSILVGVLFAVFGQIYQTGANAYDFFLIWTLCISLWVWISNFAPLWLLYLLLINSTLILYNQQVAGDWSDIWLSTLLFLLNGSVLVVATCISMYRHSPRIPTYFLNITALAAVSFGTIGIISGIFHPQLYEFPMLLLSCGAAFAVGIWYGLKTKSGFYLSVIPFSLTIIASALLIKISEDEWMLLFISIFIITSATFIIRNLVNLHKKQQQHHPQTLPIKIISVFGGLLASLAFTGFLVVTNLYKSSPALIISGIICIIIALAISRQHHKIVLDTISVSSYITGLILLGLGLNGLGIHDKMLYLIYLALSGCVLAIVRNYILTFSSILVIHGSVLALIFAYHAYDFVHIYVSLLAMYLCYFFRQEAAIMSQRNTLSARYDPIRSSLFFSFLGGLILLGKEGLIALSPNYIWITSMVCIAIMIYLITIILPILQITVVRQKILIYTLATLMLLPIALAPAIAGAMMLLLLSFLVNYRTGLVTSIIALIYFISQYYYDLDFTLLTKSILLCLTGILFLIVYLFTHKTSNS